MREREDMASESGKRSTNGLIKTVPQLSDLADIPGEQVANI